MEYELALLIVGDLYLLVVKAGHGETSYPGLDHREVQVSDYEKCRLVLQEVQLDPEQNSM